MSKRVGIPCIELDLRYNKLGVVDKLNLLGALESNTTITVLNLRSYDGYCLKEVGGVAVGFLLERNSTLTTLDLGFNCLTVSSVDVARALGRNTTLMTLNLDNNGLGRVGAVAIAGALEMPNPAILEGRSS